MTTFVIPIKFLNSMLDLNLFCNKAYRNPNSMATFPLGFNDNIYHEGNISKLPDFDAFSLSDIKNVINDPMVSAKMAILNENIKLFYLFLI